MSEEEVSKVKWILRDVPKLRLSALRRVVDREVNSSALSALIEGTPITCGGKGCNGCCRGDIKVSGDELEDLLLLMTDEVMDEVLSRADEIEDLYRRERAPCPLLGDDGLCSIYESRPMACRVYQVISPPELCVVEIGKKPTQVSKMVPNRAMALILKAMDEEYSLLLEILRVARSRVEEQRGDECLTETVT